MVAAPASSIPPAVPASLRPSLASVLRETGLTALVAFGLFLPLIGLETVQNIRNELVLDTRFVLLGAMVAIIAALRFVQVAFVAPWLAGGGLDLTIPPDARALIARWGKPAVLAFVVIYPIAAFVIAGPSAGKWIDNFGVQILIYVLLGWGLNIVVGLAGLLDLGYVAFYAIGAYTVALLGKSF